MKDWKCFGEYSFKNFKIPRQTAETSRKILQFSLGQIAYITFQEKLPWQIEDWK